MSKPPLKEFQRENVEWIQRVGRGLLADEPGLGKSRSALEGLEGAESVLIIAPSLVLETGVWHEQVELWGFDDTEYRVAPFSQLNLRKDRRTKQEIEKGKPHRHAPVKALDPYVKRHWDAVIVDEAHYIKGRDSKWTWATKQIARDCDSMILLTGTPIPNWAHEVFTLLQMIYPQESKPGRKYGSFWRWAADWFDCSPTFHSQGNPVVGEMLGCTPRCMRRDPDDPCEHYIAFANANLGSRFMRHLRSEHLDLPPIEYVDLPTPMGSHDRALYNELRKDFATNVDGHEILAWSQGAKNVLLDKFTTSPWLLHKQGEPSGGKLEHLRRDVQASDRPQLVLAHYQDSVEAAARVAELAGRRVAYVHGGVSDRSAAGRIRDFKSGKLDVLVGSLETMAESFTLTVADTAIFLERSYKPSRNTQATYRIYRMGQDKPCTIIRYLTPRSVDSGKERLLATKTDRQMRTLSAAEFVKITEG